MRKITVHKLRFGLDEVSAKLNITQKIKYIHASTYVEPGFIEFTLEDDEE